MPTAFVSVKSTGPVKKVVRKHHILVRITHWLNIPLLLVLGWTGMSTYWAAPVYKHTDSSLWPSKDGQSDYVVNIGHWAVKHVPFQSHYTDPDNWVYNHFSLGGGELATALNLHWLFAYLFMLNGLVYLIGLGLGGGYRSLLPRTADAAATFAMLRYYLGIVPAKIAKRPWPHPVVTGKYNALQKGAYFAMPVFGGLSVLSGWALHKSATLGWLQGLFLGYDNARIVHFWLMWVFLAFVFPHVILVAADGWDTFRSMVVGWSARISASEATTSEAPGPKLPR